MKKLGFLTRLRRKLKDRKGQSTTEYILILAIVVMIASKMKTKLLSTVEGTMGTIDKNMADFNSN